MERIKEDVESMLKEHYKNQAKLMEIELKLEEHETELEYAGMVYIEDEDEVIRGMQLSGSAVSDMPRGNTNKISDNTYDTATNYKKETFHINKKDRQHIENKIFKLKILKDELNKKIVRVDNLIHHLPSEEKFVIETYYMEKSKWDYVSEKYCAEFQKPKSINQLLNIRDNAMKNMLDVINTGI